MDPITIGVSAITIAKGISDLYNSYTSDKTRPAFVIPQGMQNALQTAKYLSAQKKLPGQSLIQDQLSSNTAQGLKAIQTTSPNTSSTLGALSQLYANQQKGVAQLGIASAQNQNQNIKNLQSTEEKMAGWESKQQDWNTLQPYVEEMNKSAQFESSGWQNIMGSLNNLVGYQETKDMWSNYAKLMGGKVPETTTTVPTFKLNQKSDNSWGLPTDEYLTPDMMKSLSKLPKSTY